MSTIKIINKTKEIDSKVRGKAINLNQSNQEEAKRKMSQAMGAVRRDYKVKDSNSQASAAKVILTA